MKTPTTLSVLVPAYNEQYLVYASLERLKILAESPLLERIEVIVVDDGSTDQTPSVLREFERSISAETNAKMKWVFLRQEVNQGKAAAIRTALQCATAELAVTHDADLEYHPLDLLKLVQVFLGRAGRRGLWFPISCQRVPARAVFPSPGGEPFFDSALQYSLGPQSD
jgi:glycosyltransferase involved in cell wall biosynthesis